MIIKIWLFILINGLFILLNDKLILSTSPGVSTLYSKVPIPIVALLDKNSLDNNIKNKKKEFSLHKLVWNIIPFTPYLDIHANGFESCLEEYQYPFYHAFRETKSCARIIYLLEHMVISNGDTNDPLKSNKTKWNDILKYIYQLKQKSSTVIHNICSIYTKSMYPCLQGLDKHILNLYFQCPMIRLRTDNNYTFPITWWFVLKQTIKTTCGIHNKLNYKKNKGYNNNNIFAWKESCSQSFFSNYITPSFHLKKINSTNDCKIKVKLDCANYLRKYLGVSPDLFKYQSKERIQSLNDSVNRILNYCTDNTNLYKVGSSFLTMDNISQEVYQPLIPWNDPKINDIQFNPYYIEQIHLSYGNNETNMNIMWVTRKKTKKTILYYAKDRFFIKYILNTKLFKKYVLKYWPFVHKKEGTTTNYLKDLGNYHAGHFIPQTYHHLVQLHDLEPNTNYYYYIINEKENSNIYTFKTPITLNEKKKNRLNQNKNNKFGSIGLFGDMGLFESHQTLRDIKHYSKKVDFFFHLGDISYADNAYLHNFVKFGYERTYNTFMQAMQPVAAYKPYMVIPGNHEIECHSPFVCLQDKKILKILSNFTAYNNRFHMPSEKSEGKLNLWYSFNFGPIHFVVINTDSDFPNHPKDSFTKLPFPSFGNQSEWLENDLKEANKSRNIRPWIILLGHRPIYSVSKRNSNNPHFVPYGIEKIIKKWIEPYMEKYQIDMYISGHVHRYERHLPVFNAITYLNGVNEDRTIYSNPKAPVHIIHGCSGNEEADFAFEEEFHPKKIEKSIEIDNKNLSWFQQIKNKWFHWWQKDKNIKDESNTNTSIPWTYKHILRKSGIAILDIIDKNTIEWKFVSYDEETNKEYVYDNFKIIKTSL